MNNDKPPMPTRKPGDDDWYEDGIEGFGLLDWLIFGSLIAVVIAWLVFLLSLFF